MSRGLGKFERAALHSIAQLQEAGVQPQIDAIRFLMAGAPECGAYPDGTWRWSSNFTHSIKRALSSLEAKGYVVKVDHGRRLSVSNCRYSYGLAQPGERFVNRVRQDQKTS